jgi:uncharacterized protein YoxC
MALHDIVTKDSTDRSVTVKIVDSADGTPETGVVFNTAGIDLWYRRELSAKVSITEVTLAALTTAHADGGFITIGDGEYRLDLPDAAFATGAQHVDFGGTVTGMVVIGGRVRLVDFDVEAALATAAALATVDTVVDEILGDTAEILWRSVAIKAETALIVADTNELQTDDTPAALAALDAVVDTVKADTAAILIDTAEIGAAGAGLTALATAAALATVDTVVDSIQLDTTAILADTNELQTDDLPALIAALNDPTTAAIVAAVWDEPFVEMTAGDESYTGLTFRKALSVIMAAVRHETTLDRSTGAGEVLEADGVGVLMAFIDSVGSTVTKGRRGDA